MRLIVVTKRNGSIKTKEVADNQTVSIETVGENARLRIDFDYADLPPDKYASVEVYKDNKLEQIVVLRLPTQ